MNHPCPPCNANCDQGQPCDAERCDGSLEMLAALLGVVAVVFGIAFVAVFA